MPRKPIFLDKIKPEILAACKRFAEEGPNTSDQLKRVVPEIAAQHQLTSHRLGGISGQVGSLATAIKDYHEGTSAMLRQILAVKHSQRAQMTQMLARGGQNMFAPSQSSLPPSFPPLLFFRPPLQLPAPALAIGGFLLPPRVAVPQAAQWGASPGPRSPVRMLMPAPASGPTPLSKRSKHQLAFFCLLILTIGSRFPFMFTGLQCHCRGQLQHLH